MTMRQRHGQATDKGNRPKNQDRLMVHQLSTHQHCFGVFDGHGENGEKVADYVAAEMAKRLDAELKALGDDGAKSVDRVSAMLQRVFDAIDEDLLSSEDIDTYMSGSTAIVALFLPNGQLVVAGCGDSRALLVRQRDGPDSDVADFEQLSTDHNCENLSEQERLKSSGANLSPMQSPSGEFEGPLRIYKGSMPYPGLAVSRSFGDQVAKRLGVKAEPDIRIHKLTKRDIALVLACDGIWDGLTNQKVANLVAEHRCETDVDGVAKQLNEAALKGLDEIQIDDNCSNCIVYLEHEQ